MLFCSQVARHLRLHHLPQFKNVCYGVMLEEMAKEGDPAAYPTINVGIRGGGCKSITKKHICTFTNI